MAETPDENEVHEVVPEVPEKWKHLPIADMVDKGWRPRVKAMGDRSYITMRYGSQERSLGAFTEERWSLLMEMYPKLKTLSHKAIPATKGSLLRTDISKPQALKPSALISVETLAWYEWAQTRGYPGNLGDFLNEVVHDYFKREGLSVVIVREGN